MASDEPLDGASGPADDRDGLAALLDHLHRARGFDFSGYKRTTVERRVGKRLQALGIPTYGGYLDHLQVDPNEYAQLFDTLLINVTRFFRDAEAWDHLRDHVLPDILSDKEPGSPIRVWSAGCASGEEAYSLAIVLAEHLGIDEFRDRVKIYGTDIDGVALEQARQAVYRRQQLADMDERIRLRYFRPAPGGTAVTSRSSSDRRVSDEAAPDDDVDHWVFRNDLRQAVIFGEHNLVSNAPISRLDLLVCRNTLMYFDADLQRHVLQRFHFSLRSRGVLFLGKAERLLGRSHPFQPVDGTRRFFRATPDRPPQRVLEPIGGRTRRAVDHVTANLDLRDAALDAGPAAKIAVDLDGFLVTANERARHLFQLRPRDLGRPLRDLDVSFRPAELRGAIAQAIDTGARVALERVHWTTSSGDEVVLDVEVIPLADDDGPLGVAITFVDVTLQAELHQELEVLAHRLDTAHEELQASHEELETTNEELQSTVEELETTNEELQSTNEELETTNEELQSTNDELHATNDELHRRTNELHELNALLASVLRGLNRGVVVVDPELLVQVWNDRAEAFWGLREDEVLGRNFLTLDIGIPVAQIRDVLRDQLTGDGQVTELLLHGRDQRGRAVACTVACSPLVGTHGDHQGAVMLMELANADADST